jgi:biotin synthase
VDRLTRKYITDCLNTDKPEELFQAADKIRKDYCTDKIHIRGIIEFSNYCKRDCLYCGLRKSNKNITRYRMDEAEILHCAVRAGNSGYKTILLQSGEDEAYSIDKLCQVVSSIKKKAGCAITLSIGEKSFDDYKRLKEAGADRYLLRFETSDKKLFKKLKPDSSYESRLLCVENLIKLGYQVGSGIMVGLPGQAFETLADDILLMKRLELDMIGIGPFLPHHNTPLCDAPSGTLDLTLRMLSLIRIAMPDTHIPATTAVGTVEATGRQQALKCGCNVIMPNITPSKYRKFYEIYPDKVCIGENFSDCYSRIEKMAESLGRNISKDYGHSIKLTTPILAKRL